MDVRWLYYGREKRVLRWWLLLCEQRLHVFGWLWNRMHVDQGKTRFSHTLTHKVYNNTAWHGTLHFLYELFSDHLSYTSSNVVPIPGLKLRHKTHACHGTFYGTFCIMFYCLILHHLCLLLESHFSNKCVQ